VIDRRNEQAGRTPAGSHGLAATAMVADTMAATLILARALVTSGHRIDLDGVEREIGDLCAETVALPRDQGVLLRPALEQLLREVEALESDLSARLAGPAAP
jgi:hypothetical protein